MPSRGVGPGSDVLEGGYCWLVAGARSRQYRPRSTWWPHERPRPRDRDHCSFGPARRTGDILHRRPCGDAALEKARLPSRGLRHPGRPAVIQRRLLPEQPGRRQWSAGSHARRNRALRNWVVATCRSRDLAGPSVPGTGRVMTERGQRLPRSAGSVNRNAHRSGYGVPESVRERARDRIGAGDEVGVGCGGESERAADIRSRTTHARLNIGQSFVRCSFRTGDVGRSTGKQSPDR
jgi:hypothetical protein